MPNSVELIPARTPAQVAVARQLLLEYADAIAVDLEYQDFSAELAALPSPYEPPHGTLLVAYVDGTAAGCVALRRLDENTGEMKRLYVRSAFRGAGLARRLVAGVILAARRADYAELRLDTLPSMESAQALYRQLGFAEIAAYNDTHLPGTRFYAFRLAPLTP